jgi:hypothetical protein
VNPEPHRRRAAIACAVLGLAVLMLSAAFLVLPPVQTAWAAGCADALAVQRFQLARSEFDLVLVFGARDDECRALVVAAMDTVNRLDLFAFIPIYAGFLISSVFMLAPYPRSHVAVAAFAATALAACGDVVETAAQLAITHNVDAPSSFIPALQIGAWAKYGFLAVHGVLTGALALVGSRRPWIIAVLGFSTPAAVLAASIDPLQRAPLMSLAIAAFWLSLLVASIVRMARLGARARSAKASRSVAGATTEASG